MLFATVFFWRHRFGVGEIKKQMRMTKVPSLMEWVSKDSNQPITDCPKNFKSHLSNSCSDVCYLEFLWLPFYLDCCQNTKLFIFYPLYINKLLNEWVWCFIMCLWIFDILVTILKNVIWAAWYKSELLSGMFWNCSSIEGSSTHELFLMVAEPF